MAFFRAIILGVGESLLAIPYLYHDETLLRLKYLIFSILAFLVNCFTPLTFISQ